MILQRFYDDGLSQASYLVACGASGDGIVVDPNRDVDQYLRAAEAEGVRITHVTETHIHADFVSGARELAQRTGARLYLSDEGGDDWKYAYAAEADAVLLKHGDSFRVGNVRFEVLHTPGHTPEHISFLVTDTAGADRPMGIFTGDFVFVNDVGRPDLLERAANVAGTMEAGARTLFRSLRSFRELPDHLQIWPGHGAGSACGKSLSGVPQSTVGYERRFSWPFSIDDDDEFVRAVLSGQPEPPRYFGEMKRVNRDGPRLLGGLQRPPRLAGSRLAEVIQSGSIVVDTRPAVDHAAGHVPGTINIPADRSFATWAGWLLPYDRDLHLIVDDRSTGSIERVVRSLALIGLDRVGGYFTGEAVESWARHGGELGTVPQMETGELARRVEGGDVEVVDVRSEAEWVEGHLPGARHIPLGHLAERAGELPRDVPLVLHCQTGARSSIGASLLRSQGFDNVVNLTGGYGAWAAGGHPAVRP